MSWYICLAVTLAANNEIVWRWRPTTKSSFSHVNVLDICPVGTLSHIPTFQNLHLPTW